MCWLHQSAQLWSYPTFLLIPLMLIGCIECFAGYRAWRFLVGVNGAVLGFVAGATLSMLLGAPMLILVGAIGGAVAGGLFFTAVAPVGTFVFALGSTASLTLVIAAIVGLPTPLIIPLATFVGLAGGAAALARWRPVMIGIVCIAGAQQIASAWRAHQLPYGEPPLPDIVTRTELAAFIALATAGLLVQFLDVRGRRLGWW